VIPLLQPLCRMPRPERRGLLGTEPEMPEPASSSELLPEAPARERLQGAGSGCLLGPVRCGRRTLAAAASGVGWGSDSPQAVCRRLGAHAGMGCRREAAVLLGTTDEPVTILCGSGERWPLAALPCPGLQARSTWAEPKMPEPVLPPELLPDASARERPQGAGWVCPLGPVRCVRRTLAAFAAGVGLRELVHRRPCVAGWVSMLGWAAGETRPSLGEQLTNL